MNSRNVNYRISKRFRIRQSRVKIFKEMFNLEILFKYKNSFCSTPT